MRRRQRRRRGTKGEKGYQDPGGRHFQEGGRARRPQGQQGVTRDQRESAVLDLTTYRLLVTMESVALMKEWRRAPYFNGLRSGQKMRWEIHRAGSWRVKVAGVLASDSRTVSGDRFECTHNQRRREVKTRGDRHCRGVRSQRRQEVLAEKQVLVLERHGKAWRVHTQEAAVQPRPLGSLSIAHKSKLCMGGGEILVTVRKEWQGLDPPSHMKQLATGTKYVKQ